MLGLHTESPPLPTARSRKISNVKPCPNWSLIKRTGDLTEEELRRVHEFTEEELRQRGYISDTEFKARYDMLRTVREQMIKHPNRRLIPISVWDDLVEYAILKAVTTWKGNGDGKCPLKNYAWVLLRNTAIQWWNKNKMGVLDCIELDRGFMQDE